MPRDTSAAAIPNISLGADACRLSAELKLLTTQVSGVTCLGLLEVIRQVSV